MNYKLIPSQLFLQQLEQLSKKAKNIIEQKLILVKENPFRYKRIYGYKLFLLS